MNKAILLTKKRRYAIYMLVITCLIGMAYAYIRTPDVSMRIIYTPGLEEHTQNAIAYDYGEGYSQETTITVPFDVDNTARRRYFELFLPIPTTYQQPEAMKIMLQPKTTAETTDIIQIKCIEFYNHHISMAKYSPADLFHLFTFEETEQAYVDRDRLCIIPDGEHPGMVATSSFLEEYQTIFTLTPTFYYNLLLLWLLLFIVTCLADTWMLQCYDRYRQTQKHDMGHHESIPHSVIDVMKIIMMCLIFAGAIGVIYMALQSQHYAHPDEDVTRLAIDYYMGGWIPPDVRSRAVMGTFSYFGYTRLDEPTLYYLLAGKFGWFCATFLHISRYYRMFNVLLFLIMVGLLLVKGKKNPWMILALGITPQIWYLFSYATSDAFDYFLTFIVIYQFLTKESMLNQLLEKRAKHPCIYALTCGCLFAMLLCAKQNYYLVLLFAFCILLQRWWRAKRADKPALLRTYLLILLCTFLLFGLRIGINYYHYGTYNTGAAGGEMTDLNAAEEYRSATVAKTGIHLSQAGQGKTLSEVFFTYGKDILTGLIWSGTGNYGWLEYPHMRVYGYLLAIIYGLVYLKIVIGMIRQDKKEGIKDSLLLTSFLGLAYAMVLYICWKGDFQTQGRYVLLLCPIVAYYSTKCKALSQDKGFHILLLILCTCSFYSFVCNGLYHLI